MSRNEPCFPGTRLRNPGPVGGAAFESASLAVPCRLERGPGEALGTLVEQFRTVAIPTLIMLGDRDVVKPEHAVEMLWVFPHGQLAVFPGSSHGAYLGVVESSTKPGSPLPQAMATLLEEFLEE